MARSAIMKGASSSTKLVEERAALKDALKYRDSAEAVLARAQTRVDAIKKRIVALEKRTDEKEATEGTDRGDAPDSPAAADAEAPIQAAPARKRRVAKGSDAEAE